MRFREIDADQAPRESQSFNFEKWIRGLDVVKDAVLSLDKFKKSNYGDSFGDKTKIFNALENQDKEFLRSLSLYYYGTSGIYAGFIKYLAGILTYDWLVYPNTVGKNYNKSTVKKDMDFTINFLDDLYLKNTLYNITFTTVLNGVYYGYLVIDGSGKGTIMDLPIQYCRCRYKINNIPAVEFNVKYFDSISKPDVRQLVLNNMPKEFRINYKAYKDGKLPTDSEDMGAWFLCNQNFAMRFTLGTKEIPIFSAVIPTIMDLDQAKDLDMKKTMQELLKILIQKMPLDKNGDMIFDLDEARVMHNNLCRMLENAVNVDVLTTFGEVSPIDLQNTSMATADPLEKVERGVYNEAGISPMLFATDGNLSLEKSIINDESIMFSLLSQYEQKLNQIINYIKKGKSTVKISFPRISAYNKEKMQKMFKEMATAGYSKLMPAIAAGQSQSEFLSLLDYEKNILGLEEKMTPLQISSTQSSKNSNTTGEEKKVGAPEKDDSEKSEKTIQNRESMS